MISTRTLSAFAVAALFATPAFSQTIFPPSMRVGIVPMEGLVPAKDFAGFESPDKSVKVGVTEIPEQAYIAVDTAVKEGKQVGPGPKPESIDTQAGKAYFTVEEAKVPVTVRNYSLIAPGGKFSGYVIAQVPENADKKYSDEAVRKMLASTAIRTDVPIAEQLEQLPFKVSELADFKTVRTLAPRVSILLTDGTEETTLDGAPYIVIGLMQGAPATPDDRARFAQQVATSIPGLRDGKFTANEAIRIDGSPGFETRIDAVTGKDNTPVTVVQWLRFGSGNSSLRIIASSTRDDWPKAFPRFRAVRDGLGPK